MKAKFSWSEKKNLIIFFKFNSFWKNVSPCNILLSYGFPTNQIYENLFNAQKVTMTRKNGAINKKNRTLDSL